MSRVDAITRKAAAVLVLALIGLTVGTAGAPAVAAEGDPAPFWFLEKYDLDAAAAEGATGAGITVAVVDAQMYPDVPTLQGVDLQFPPNPLQCLGPDGSPIETVSSDPVTAAHGTNSVSLVAGSGAGFPGQQGVRGAAPEATVQFFSMAGVFVDEEARKIETLCLDETGQKTWLGKAIQGAVAAGADIISIQIDNNFDDYSQAAIAEALRSGVIVLAGLPNIDLHRSTVPDQGPNLSNMNGVIGVQAVDSMQRSQEDAGPQGNPTTDVAAPGVAMGAQGGPGASSWEEQTVQTGTSNATPFTAGILAAVWSKYPDATGNQIIQSLLRNTGTEDHEFVRQDDFVGYGIVSLRHMLAEDPTQYPDVNPLIVDDRGAEKIAEWLAPRYEEIFPDSVAPTEEPGNADAPSGPAAGVVVPLIIGAVAVGGLLLVGVVVLVIVLAVRAGRRGPGQV